MTDSVKQPKKTDIKLFCCFLNELGVGSEEWLQPFKDGKASKRSVGKMSQRGYIYCMKCVGKDYVKIGLAVSPSKRLQNLQQGCPYKLEIKKVWEVDNMKAAEKLAHNAMAPYNRGQKADNKYKTEWFDVPKGGLKDVCKIVSGAISKHLVVTRVEAGAAGSSKTGGSSKTKTYTWAAQNGGNLNSMLL